jgi:hypothetical protein
MERKKKGEREKGKESTHHIRHSSVTITSSIKKSRDKAQKPTQRERL